MKVWVVALCLVGGLAANTAAAQEVKHLAEFSVRMWLYKHELRKAADELFAFAGAAEAERDTLTVDKAKAEWRAGAKTMSANLRRQIEERFIVHLWKAKDMHQRGVRLASDDGEYGKLKRFCERRQYPETCILAFGELGTIHRTLYEATVRAQSVLEDWFVLVSAKNIHYLLR